MGISRGDIWSTITASVQAGERFETWSAAKRARGLPFTVEEISPAAVVVSIGDRGGLRRLARTDFERIAEVWSIYIERKLARSELGKLSQNSSYIVSLIHHRGEAVR